MSSPLPQRLNLAVARGCYVKCSGCYSLFGGRQPDLDALAASAARFVELGVDAVTLSGGDPLTLPDLLPFLDRLRAVGFTSIKLDTVGTGLLSAGPDPHVDTHRLCQLGALVDIIGVPLDGASNASMNRFRRGRSALFDEALILISAILKADVFDRVVINTLLHSGNIADLDDIFACLSRLDGITDWSIFQYTATDQADDATNAAMRIDDADFASACEALRLRLSGAQNASRVLPYVQFRSAASRLGDYLLINSDGEAWLPDEHGNTQRLGSVFGREADALEGWRTHAARLTSLKHTLPDWVPGSVLSPRKAGV